ncbi:MAG: bifunctional aspartate kinase/diaminopimelate decarboxylase, partial [Gammaproteobacteria bacterium]
MNGEDAVSPGWTVLKFGGTSVATAERWHAIAAEVRHRLEQGQRVVIVHSALAGVSNRLVALLDAALAGKHLYGVDEIEHIHLRLAADLGLDRSALIADEIEQLRQVLDGIHLLNEVSPRAHARVLASGEMMATRLGAAYLSTRGLPCHWLDARSVLESRREDGGGRGRYLNASCDFDADPLFQQTLAGCGPLVLTQGFIARDHRGDTVLLGRGGSDVSAAYIAAKLQATAVEIWTDVPGMFSADPRIVTAARLLRSLDYAEAQEIASTGGAVLHPRSVPPVRRHGIPMEIRCTSHPEMPGTRISATPADGAPRVKAISINTGLTLVSMETSGMWQQVGFLADAFRIFGEHRVSVDLVSTSETSVTVSIDQEVSSLDEEAMDGLVRELGRLCRVRVIGGCAAVSLVGRQIRAILHRLGPALELFEEHRIHLVSQAASDLNLTFVVDEEQAHRLVKRLHHLLIRVGEQDAVLGPTWEQLFGAAVELGRPVEPWWLARRDELLALAPVDAAAFVYDLEIVDQSIRNLQSLTAIERVCYATKANWHPAVLQRVHDAGLTFECVSVGELEHVRLLFPGLDPARILFTPNFAPRTEYEQALASGVRLTLDNLYPLVHWPELFAGAELFARIDPGAGKGHHRHVQTAGEHSKFGIPISQVDQLATLAHQCGARIIGLHVHAGSGILDSDHWSEMAGLLARVAASLPEVAVFNLGGGLGVPESGADAPLDMAKLDASLTEVRDAFPDYALWLEPGRYVVAAAGVLVARVTQTKGKGEIGYVGINTGMNSLIRPALYGAFHEIVNLSRIGQPATRLTDVVGPICETGDYLGVERLLPPAEEGDVILIANAGAYGRVMSSRYNLREPAGEMVMPSRDPG